MIKPKTQPTDTLKSYNGLCLGYYQLQPQEIGSRRFRYLSPYFAAGSIKLETLAGYSQDGKSDEDTSAVKSFSPFSSTLDRLWRLKRRLAGGGSGNSDVGEDNQAVYKASNQMHEITKDDSLRSLILSIYYLPDPFAGWILPVIIKALVRRKKYDFVISTAPPWSAHIAAIIIGRLFGLPVILDDRDPWASSSGRMALITHPLIRKIDKFLADYCYSRASGIVSVTTAARDYHNASLPNDQIPVACFANGYGPDMDEFCQPPVYTNELNITYVGSTYHGRSPLIVLEAMAQIDGNIAKDFHFHFIGTIVQPELDAINELDKKYKVTIHGYKSHKYCLEAIDQADLCLLMALGQPMQIPAKVYEYIGMGRPILSLSEKDDATMQLLKSREWAWTVASGDKAGLSRILADIHKQWQDNNLPRLKRNSDRENYSFENMAVEYSKFIKQVISDVQR